MRSGQARSGQLLKHISFVAGRSIALPFTAVFSLIGGAIASVAGPNLRAVLLNVNEPETRGVAFALQVGLQEFQDTVSNSGMFAQVPAMRRIVLASCT